MSISPPLSLPLTLSLSLCNPNGSGDSMCCVLRIEIWVQPGCADWKHAYKNHNLNLIEKRPILIETNSLFFNMVFFFSN